MTGGELAVVIGAIVGGFAGLGGLIAVITNALVNARTKAMDEQLDHMGKIINEQHRSDMIIIDDLRGQFERMRDQIKVLQEEAVEHLRQINDLRDANAKLIEENTRLRIEVTELRCEVEAYKTGKKAKPGTAPLRGAV